MPWWIVYLPQGNLNLPWGVVNPAEGSFNPGQGGLKPGRGGLKPERGIFDLQRARFDPTNLSSNSVLAHLPSPLVALGFLDLGPKIQDPVLFGLDGQFEKSFEAEAYHEAADFVGWKLASAS